MTDNNARKKYVLSRHLDALIDRLINQDFRRRLSKNDFNDGWLKKILDPKEHEEYYDLDKSITEQDLRNEVRSLYFECLLEELSVKGYSQRRIADIMKISLALVNDDLQFLRSKARDNISKYIDDYLPAEYENCLDGLNSILTEAWTISTDSESDKRERMQALTLAKECYAMKLDLLSSATVIDRAVKFVERNRGFIHENEVSHR